MKINWDTVNYLLCVMVIAMLFMVWVNYSDIAGLRQEVARLERMQNGAVARIENEVQTKFDQAQAEWREELDFIHSELQYAIWPRLERLDIYLEAIGR